MTNERQKKNTAGSVIISILVLLAGILAIFF